MNTMRFRIPFFLIVTASALLLATLCTASADDFNAWQRKMKITFSGYDKSEMLTNFPALVTISTNITNFSYADFESDIGGDLRFTDSTETNELNYEIEAWDTNASSFVWVQTLELTSSACIYAFWGNSSATNPPVYTTNGVTWSEGYGGVWHLAESPANGGTNYDSTTNQVDATFYDANGNSDTFVSGQIGGAVHLNGDADYIEVPHNASINPAQTLTISIWAKSDNATWNEVGYLMSKRNAYLMFPYPIASTSVRFYIHDGSAWNPVSYTLSSITDWHHYVGTYNGATLRFYIDGANVTNLSYSATINADTGVLTLGRDDGQDRYLDGWLDEARVSNVTRSSNWVWACWMNQASNSTFNSYEMQDTDIPGVNNSAATNITGTSAWLNGMLTSTGAAPTTVFVYLGFTDATTNKTAWAYTNDFGQSALGGLSTNVTDLSSNTTYYYRFYATNSYGEDWASPSESFKTRAVPAVDNDGGASYVGRTVATLNGNLTNGAVADIYIYWGMTDAGITNSEWANTNYFGELSEGPFNTNLSSLTQGTTYYYRCYATNIAGEAWADSTTNFTTALFDTYYVTTTGDDTANGLTWATAFLTISNAVAKTTSGDTVIVSNGTYTLAAQIYITNGITVQSLNGLTNTIVNGGYPGSINRCFYVNHTNAVVDGFTITNAYVNASGGGVYLSGGILQNSLITGCKGDWTVTIYGRGVYITGGGIVSNCSIIGNSDAKYGVGAAIWQSGTLKNSTISGNNSPYYQAGGVYLYYGGLVRNCLITRNSTRGPGGVYLVSGGTVESCTISRNTATSGGGGAPGGGVGGTGGTIRNSIIYFNTASDPDWGDNWASGPSYSYNCTTPAVGGTSNITDDPLLKDAANDNYRLLPGSPCIDAGQSNSWMAGAKDLDGNDRIIGSTVDIGAYEFKVGDLTCGFVADSTKGFDPHTVVFTGYVSGTNLTGLCYLWDVDNNGSIDYQGPAVSVVTNAYTSGVFTVSLTVTNAAGETNNNTRENYITVGPATSYVDSASASPAFPYASWATAATNIQDAVNAGVDGTIVLVTNGTYEVSSQVSITKGVTVQSVNGAEVTTIKSMSSGRSIYTYHVDAVLDGFTLTKGSQTYGGGAYISYGGTVRNCIIRGNKQNSSYGNAVTMMSGGTVESCKIIGNTNLITTAYPGGVWLQSGTLRNCLITDNLAYGTVSAGVHINAAGTVESCTISGNRSSKNAATAVGGLSIQSGGTVRNCIIYFNTNTVTHSSTNWYKTGGTITYTDTTPAASGTGNITDDPTFKNADAGDYRLQVGSPCVDVGQDKSWMTNACDLGGNDRIIPSVVDIGAYELRTVGTVIHIR